MENASKALIIAGAILISIVLIGIGVLIVNSTQGITDEVGSQFSTQEKQAFNRQFESYESNSQTAGNVRSLLSAVISSNSTNVGNGNKIVSVTCPGGSTNTNTSANISGSRSALDNNKKYKVVLTYNTAGLVSLVTITQN